MHSRVLCVLACVAAVRYGGFSLAERDLLSLTTPDYTPTSAPRWIGDINGRTIMNELRSGGDSQAHVLSAEEVEAQLKEEFEGEQAKAAVVVNTAESTWDNVKQVVGNEDLEFSQENMDIIRNVWRSGAAKPQEDEPDIPVSLAEAIGLAETIDQPAVDPNTGFRLPKFMSQASALSKGDFIVTNHGKSIWTSDDEQVKVYRGKTEKVLTDDDGNTLSPQYVSITCGSGETCTTILEADINALSRAKAKLTRPKASSSSLAEAPPITGPLSAWTKLLQYLDGEFKMKARKAKYMWYQHEVVQLKDKDAENTQAQDAVVYCRHNECQGKVYKDNTAVKSGVSKGDLAVAIRMAETKGLQ